MSPRVTNLLRFMLVTGAVVLITSFSVDATDALRGSQTALSIFARKATEATCPAEMVMVRGDDGPFCIDRFEAGVASVCPFPEPFSVIDTASNAQASGCVPVAQAGVLPWRFVSKLQAEQLCARAGKQLPSASEWYTAALGTIDNDDVCNTRRGSVHLAGQSSECISGVGALDMIGNVWELTRDSITDGKIGDGVIPDTGYVEAVLPNGLASRTTTTPQAMFNNDYFWSNATGSYAVMRGGFYGSKADGGLYSTQAAIENDFASAAIGFRCVKRL